MIFQGRVDVPDFKIEMSKKILNLLNSLQIGFFWRRLIFCKHHYTYKAEFCEQFVSRRSLPAGIMDVDCERIYGIYFDAIGINQYQSLRSNSATNLCFGLSGLDYCARGKELMLEGNVKGQSSFYD